MRSTNKKLLGALAVAGIVAASGSAFTGAGLTNNAGSTQFVGGTVSQSVTGATLTNVAYSFTDATNRTADTVTLTFAADALGKQVAVALTGGAGTAFTCTNVLAISPYTSVCNGGTIADPTGIDVTVS
jgi:hypothetical protein